MKLCPKCNKQYSDDANFCPVDAARLVPLLAQAEASGGAADPLAARYELGARLGGSHTGPVHRAQDKTTGAPVAVKIVAAQVIALPGLAQRLERELKQLERVQSAGVAKVLASGKRGEDTWVATELLDGAQTLAEAIGARGPIPLEQAAHLIEVIGEALIEAAQVGVVHRDLAPKNVLFAGAEIKLINFSLPVPGDKVPGVPEFVAPEQQDGKPVDQRSNLYSLGALYYYVLTGQAPQVDAGAVRPPSQLAAVPPPVEGVIMRALDRSPTKRFLTVRQFVDEVTRVARGEAVDVDLKGTRAMGRAGKPKAELVQTLLGVRSGGVPAGPQPNVGSQPAIVPSTVVGMTAPVVPTRPGTAPPVAQPPMQQPPMQQPPMQQPPMQQPMQAAQTQLGQPDRSPWAPPPGLGGPQMPMQQAPMPMQQPPMQQPPMQQPPMPQQPMPPQMPMPQPMAMPPQMAMPQPMPPQPAAPVLAAPVVAAPQVANAAAGKKKPDEPKGKFRETMWFKKGDLDAQAAQAAAEERAKTGKDVAGDKADSLPIDERYKDDGSISRGDKEKYSLRTGATMMMSAVNEPGAAGGSTKVSEDALIGEMKGGRNVVFIVIALVVAGLAVLIYFLAR